MEGKEYKYWRYSYESHETEVWLPNNLKLYKTSETGEPINTKLGYGCESYVGVIPYDEAIYKFYNPDSEVSEDGKSITISKVFYPWNGEVFNVNDTYIVFVFTDIFPISEDWPVTKVFPTMVPQYLKCYGHKIKCDAKELVEKLLSAIDEAEKLGLIDEEKEEYVQSHSMTVCEYIKINGLSKKSGLDITRVKRANYYDGKPLYEIERTDCEINFFHDEHKKIKYINSEEFNKQVNLALKDLNI